MNAPDLLLVFQLKEQRFALPLSAVERVVRAVEVTALPQMPPVVLGVINLGGRVLPVLNLAKLFDLEPASAPAPELELSDHFLIVCGAGRTMALLANAVSGVVRCDDGEMVAGKEFLPGAAPVEGLLKLPDGLVAVCDPDRFLSLVETRFLEEISGPRPEDAP